ncbi:MAG: DUF6624 domain-containing protein [Patescibacteria group bacterium]
MGINEQLVSLIKDMTRVDQDLRLKAKDGQELLNHLIYLVDTSHNYRIHKLINDTGYPSTSLVGSETMKDFWLLIQHQDYDPSLQQACLENCDFGPKEKAFLTDRICMNNNLPQLYGTQYKLIDGVRSLYDIKDLAKVNTLRESVGLPPLIK